MDNSQIYPKLRLLDIRPLDYEGQPALLLRDPLELAETSILIPRAVAPILALCDGTHHRRALRLATAERFGIWVDQGQIDQLLDALDRQLLLDNDRSARAQAAALAAYRAAPFRPPALAGEVYPAAPDDLRAYLRGHLDGVDVGQASAAGRGVISPHIDYARGAPVYAALWSQAAAAARAADLVVLLGTDHGGGDPITLTRQHYATPLGVLPTDRAIVDALAEAVGAEAAFAGELRHRREHSIELAAVWLHMVRGERPVALVPILCGSLGPLLGDASGAARDRTLTAIVETLRRATAGRRTLIVAAGDLAHVGPAFGGAPLDAAGLAALRASDAALLDPICAGDAEGFFSVIQRTGDHTNVCGVAPIYLALRLLGGADGTLLAYDTCPADDAGTSVVSICGVALG